ncbi:MAG: glycosyltransferase family protein [Gaiellaceae bacterium]
MSGRPRLVDEGGILVLSYFYPPMSNGPAFVLSALLGQLDSSGSVVFAGEPDRYSDYRDLGPSSEAGVRRFDVPAWWPLEDRPLLRLRVLGNLLVAARVTVEAVRTLRRRELRAVLAVYPKQHFLLAGVLASLVARKPLVVYFMDVYVEGLPRGRRVARAIERLVARRASAALAMSAPHREHLEARLRGVPVYEVPHPYEPLEAEPVAVEGTPAIVFTGAVYDAQADAVRRLIEALDDERLRASGACVNIFSQAREEELARWGVRASGQVRIRRVSRAQARGAQRAADILFLPMAFDGNRDVTRTASPGKLPEYLAAGRPILVHAPAEAYIACYAREQGFAEVVDERDVRGLAGAVAQLAGDDLRREELVAAARATLERHKAARGAEVVRAAIAGALA